MGLQEADRGKGTASAGPGPLDEPQTALGVWGRGYVSPALFPRDSGSWGEELAGGGGREVKSRGRRGGGGEQGAPPAPRVGLAHPQVGCWELGLRLGSSGRSVVSSLGPRRPHAGTHVAAARTPP